MTPTYNTGKVRIGLSYQPPRRVTFDRHDTTIQLALLQPARRPGLASRLIAKLTKPS